MITLCTDRMQIAVHEPLDGFYKGTRFDHSGVFDSLMFDGTEMCGRWFPHYDPSMHDAVCGPAEEFSPIGYNYTKGFFLKIGVGVLRRPDNAPYDRFRLYEVLEPGVWDVHSDESHAFFRHTVKGVYEYEKEIAFTGEDSFEIRHHLSSEVALDGEVYNHNFFTMGKMAVGPSREMDFPFCPVGEWRTEYDSVHFTHSGIRFLRDLREGETVYAGNIHAALSDGMPYQMTLREAPLSVSIKGNVPVTRAVMWSSHRIACIEPYNDFKCAPGKPFNWTVGYGFAKDRI